MVQPMAGDAVSFPYLNDLSPEAARILVKSLNRGFREVAHGKFSNSPRLNFGGISGFATLSPALAVELAKAKVPGVLQIQLKHLDSVPLAQRFAGQINWTLSNLETVSKEAAPALSQYKSFFDLRALTVLNSPEMARRFVEGTTTASAITLPALTILSPEAAEILGAGSKPIYLGLTVLDSPAVARALSRSSFRD